MHTLVVNPLVLFVVCVSFKASVCMLQHPPYNIHPKIHPNIHPKSTQNNQPSGYHHAPHRTRQQWVQETSS